MGHSLTEAYPVARATFALADTLLGFPISEIAWDGPEDNLNDTINTQPALFVHSVSAIRVFGELFPEFTPAFLAGHSMGELTTLVAAGSVTYREGLMLVRKRGELMKEAGEQSPGGMAAVLGLDISTLDEICKESSDGEDFVQVANDNCPGQVVVSGTGPALRNLLHLAKERGARRVVPLMVSIAAHSPLMSHAQKAFNSAVDNTRLLDPTIPIVGNVSAHSMTRARDIEDDLKAQLTSRVRWTESIQFIISKGVDTFIEFGTGNVLSGLIRRIDRSVSCFSLGEPEDFENFLNE